MLEEAFDPTVMFFGLTNSLAIFQIMMNNLLRNIIEKEEVAVFIDNVMIVIEAEEGHDEIMEEVLRRMEKNDLFVKPEKYVWKVREIGFLGIIIGPDGIRIKKKKVQGVVDWPVPKSIKNVQKFLGLANYYKWFVKDFTRVAKPLYEMMKKNTKWNWKER